MKKYTYVAFNKPYGVLCQFTGEPGDKTLRDFNLPKDIYAAGRLDKDSEGLMILTDDGVFNQQLTHPDSNKEKTYYVQVENIPSTQSLEAMRSGLEMKDYQAKPCEVEIMKDFSTSPRVPPIRERKSIPTSWLKIILSEGKNRQVRKMTAKIGHPTLRLIRYQIGNINIDSLAPGEWVQVERNQII